MTMLRGSRLRNFADELRDRRGGITFGDNDARVRLDCADCRGDPARDTATTERNDNRIDVRQVRDNFEADGCISRQRRRVSYRVNVQAGVTRMTALFNNLPPLIVAKRLHGRAEIPHRVEFRRRRTLRRIDRRGQTELPCDPGQPETGIARARGVNTVLHRIFDSGQYSVAHRPHLERADGLKVLEFEEDLVRTVNCIEAQQRSSNDVGSQRACCGTNFSQCRDFWSGSEHLQILIERDRQVRPITRLDQYGELS